MRGSLQRLIVEQGRIIKEFRNHQRLFVTRITNFCCCLKIQDVSQSRRWHQRKGHGWRRRKLFSSNSKSTHKISSNSKSTHKSGIARVFGDAGTPWTPKRPGFTQTVECSVLVLHINMT